MSKNNFASHKEITKSLKENDGNISKTAKDLDIPRTTLRDYIHNSEDLMTLISSLKTKIGEKKTSKGKEVNVQKHGVLQEIENEVKLAEHLGISLDDFEIDTITYRSASDSVYQAKFKSVDFDKEKLIKRAYEPVVYKPRKRKTAQKNKDHKSWIIKADYHAPRGTDEELHEVSLEAMKYIKPDAYIDLGDGSDFNALSRFAKNDMRWFSDFNEDILATRQLLADNTAALSDDAEKHYIYGNHCFRYVRWLLNDAPPGFADVEDFQLENLLRLDTFGFKLAESDTGPAYPYGEVELIPDILAATHGDRCRKGGANSVRILVETEGKSYLMGHVHDYGSTSVRIGKKIHYGFEVASMAKHDLGYARNPDHAQGFAVVNTFPDNTFMVEHAKWDPSRKVLNFRNKQWKYKGA